MLPEWRSRWTQEFHYQDQLLIPLLDMLLLVSECPLLVLQLIHSFESHASPLVKFLRLLEKGITHKQLHFSGWDDRILFGIISILILHFVKEFRFDSGHFWSTLWDWNAKILILPHFSIWVIFSGTQVTSSQYQDLPFVIWHLGSHWQSQTFFLATSLWDHL